MPDSKRRAVRSAWVIDRHNVVLAVLLALLWLALVMARVEPTPPMHMVVGAVIVLVLSGRTFTHGGDLRRARSPFARDYVLANAAFALGAAAAIVMVGELVARAVK